MEEPRNNEPNIEPVVDNPHREYLFNIVIEEMPGLQDLIQGRQDANNIIYDAIDQIVLADPDDVNAVNPHPLMRNAPPVTELERIYTNIRRLLGQQQQAPQQQAPQQQAPQQQAPQQRPQEESIEPIDRIRNNTYSRLSGSHPSGSPLLDGNFGGKLRKTSKKRPTARRRRSSKARKSRSTRRR